MTTSVKTPSSSSRPFPTGGLVILAVAVFTSVTAEMIPTGLLPEMSTELGVTESQIGFLVTFFALAVVLTSVPLVSLTRRFSRHSLVVVVLLVVSAAALFSALAPDYGWLAVARILGGVAHGLFWAVVGAYSGHLVAKEQVGRAVAIITSGGTLAIVFGVPLATVVGQAFGWRAPFVVVAVLGLCSAVLILRFLPRVSVEAAPSRRAGRSPGAERAPRDATIGGVVLICITTATIMVGHYALYTYIAPFLTTQVGIPADRIGAVLFVYGAGGAVGLLLVGLLFSRRPMLGIVIGVAATVVAVAALAFLSGSVALSISALVVWGVAFGMLPSLLQSRLLHVASAQVRDTAVAFFSSSFNIGIATGAVIGGFLLSNYGLMALPVGDLVLLLASLVLLFGSVVASHRRRARARVGAAGAAGAAGVAGGERGVAADAASGAARTDDLHVEAMAGAELAGAQLFEGQVLEGRLLEGQVREGQSVEGQVRGCKPLEGHAPDGHAPDGHAFGSNDTETELVGPKRPVDGSL
ncbi:MFS transporter [Subtercola sp. YIM 133946]|uniref:MFS transporter n=1 Tax=Subtercola sp. YIM 133946 TaxID=3118909 RepID=UPI002F94EC78